MPTADPFDIIIIGDGQGGDPLAKACAAAGMHTAMVERSQPGGTCVNWGCTPTKTMVASAEAADWARNGVKYGVRCGDGSVDMNVVPRA